MHRLRKPVWTEWTVSVGTQAGEWTPGKQRTIVQLRDIEGKSYKEIADVLGITEEQVKVNLSGPDNASN